MNNAEASLPNDLALCHELIRQQADSLEKARRRIEQLEHSVDLLLRQKYGPRSERIDPNQLRLFIEEGDEPVLMEPDVPLENPEKPKRTWKRRGQSRPLPAAPRLAVRVIISRNSPNSRPDFAQVVGEAFTYFGDEVSEQLDYKPASLFVRQFIRRKYACRPCQEHVAIPAKPPQPIDKGLPGPGLLAHVITNKYGYHLPLYRQEQILAAKTRDHLAEHALRLDGSVRRLVHPNSGLVDQSVSAVSRIIRTDDTTVPVRTPTLPGKTRTRGDSGSFSVMPRNLYCVATSRRVTLPTVPERFLTGFQSCSG